MVCMMENDPADLEKYALINVLKYSDDHLKRREQNDE